MALKPKHLSSDILVCVTNYGFSEEADDLKRRFARRLPTMLIDSSSPTPPRTADLVIANEYYPGLWNAAVRSAVAQRRPWLMFVASDVQIDDVSALCRRAVEASHAPGLGLWTPSLRDDSRVNFPACVNKGSNTLRECCLIEGFFFMARTDVLTRLYPIGRENKFGWGADVAACYVAHHSGLAAAVDDRVTIHHPAPRAEHQIETDQARDEMLRYFGADVFQWGANMLQIFR